jgi:hypothetical protein
MRASAPGYLEPGADKSTDYLLPPPPPPALVSAVPALLPATVLVEPGTTVLPVSPGVALFGLASEPIFVSATGFGLVAPTEGLVPWANAPTQGLITNRPAVTKWRIFMITCSHTSRRGLHAVTITKSPFPFSKCEHADMQSN